MLAEELLEGGHGDDTLAAAVESESELDAAVPPVGDSVLAEDVGADAADLAAGCPEPHSADGAEPAAGRPEAHSHRRVRREQNFTWGPFSFITTVRKKTIRGEEVLQHSWEATCPYHSFGSTKCCKEEPFPEQDDSARESMNAHKQTTKET